MKRTSIFLPVLALSLALAVCVALPASATQAGETARVDENVGGRSASGQAAQAAKPADPKPQTKPADRAKTAQAPKGKPAVAPSPVVPAQPVTPPPGYVIGPDDVLQVLYWREKDVSVEDVTVRPDGMITLPLLNDVKAAGLTPDQLRELIREGAKKFLEDPNVTVIIKAINSRKVFITGSVAKPGSYMLSAPMTVLQLISMAGGLTEFAKQKNLSVNRTENGRPVRFPFNYKDVANGKNLKQNIELKPGDIVIVP